MTWIEPLAMQTWMINVLTGSNEIFMAIALLAISALAGFFRMTGYVLIVMVTLFLVMFRDYVDGGVLLLIIAVGGVLIGTQIKKLVSRN